MQRLLRPQDNHNWRRTVAGGKKGSAEHKAARDQARHHPVGPVTNPLAFGSNGNRSVEEPQYLPNQYHASVGEYSFSVKGYKDIVMVDL